MGFLDKVIRVVNRTAEPVQKATTLTDPRLSRGAALEAGGAAGTGMIVGIHRRLNDSTTQTVFAIDVAGSPTEAPRRVATEVTTTRHLHRLRLGLTVPVRTAGDDRGVIDWAALATQWGLDGSEPGQRIHRKPPADGIVDTALDSRAQKRLKSGGRATATITAMERVLALGMPTVNWDVHLQLDDGSTATSRKDAVPPYAWWFAVVGATVPVAVDERDPSKASVDWPAVAVAAASSVSSDAAPPTGSIAAEVEGDAGDAASAVVAGAGASDAASTIAASRNVGHVNAALQSWVDEVHAGRMKPKAFLGNVAEWEAAGLCTPEEAASARAAAGIQG